MIKNIFLLYGGFDWTKMATFCFNAGLLSLIFILSLQKQTNACVPIKLPLPGSWPGPLSDPTSGPSLTQPASLSPNTCASCPSCPSQVTTSNPSSDQNSSSTSKELGDQVNILAFPYELDTYALSAVVIIPADVSNINIVSSMDSGGTVTNETELLAQYEKLKKVFRDDVNFKVVDLGSVKKRYVRTSSTAEATVVAIPNSATDDAYLSLPTRTWGKQYIASAYNPIRFLHSLVMIMASEENTIVKVKSIGNFDMNENDVVQVALLQADITGIEILSTKPVGVISGSACSVVPAGSASDCQQLTEQLPPVQKWGYAFVTSGTFGGDIIRVVAAEDATIVNLTGSTSTSSATITAKGGFHDFDIVRDEVVSISCGRRCLVTQIMKRSGNYRASMMVLPAVTQFRRKDISFPIPNLGTADVENYIQITTQTSETSSIILDGTSLSGEAWTTVPGMTEYSHLTRSIGATRAGHLLQANTTTATFGATAFGYRKQMGTNARSYSFPITLVL